MQLMGYNVVIFIVVLVNLIHAQRKLPFCPLERTNNVRCKSKGSAFKCGVFFLNVNPKNKFTWIAALPDALNKPSIRKDKEFVKQILNGVSRGDFVIDPRRCDNGAIDGRRLANGRCYTTMNQLKDTPLDSCDRNLLNEKSADTIGNILCKRIIPYFPVDQKKIENIEIGFGHSVCGRDWEDTLDTSGSKPLKLTEKLCCERLSALETKFYKCNGSKNFRTTC